MVVCVSVQVLFRLPTKIQFFAHPHWLFQSLNIKWIRWNPIFAELIKTTVRREFHIWTHVFGCEQLQTHRCVLTLRDVTLHDTRPNTPDQRTPLEVQSCKVMLHCSNLSDGSVTRLRLNRNGSHLETCLKTVWTVSPKKWLIGLQSEHSFNETCTCNCVEKRHLTHLWCMC